MGYAVFHNDTFKAFYGVNLPLDILDSEGTPLPGYTILEAGTIEQALMDYDQQNDTRLYRTALKKEEVEVWYENAIAAGFDTGLGFTMSIQEADQRYLMDHLLGLQATVAEEDRATTPDVLKDKDGVSHMLTVDQSIETLKAGYTYVRNLLSMKFTYETRIYMGDLDFTPGVEEPDPEEPEPEETP